MMNSFGCDRNILPPPRFHALSSCVTRCAARIAEHNMRWATQVRHPQTVAWASGRTDISDINRFWSSAEFLGSPGSFTHRTGLRVAIRGEMLTQIAMAFRMQVSQLHSWPMDLGSSYAICWARSMDNEVAVGAWRLNVRGRGVSVPTPTSRLPGRKSLLSE